jgi:hypothetical protein
MARYIEGPERYRAGRLSCGEATELLKISERHFRRLRNRYEAEWAIVQNTNIGSEVGASRASAAAFVKIESSVAASPTLLNGEVESPPKIPVPNVAAVVDHDCNPLGTLGNPIWLNNTWNNHPITLDGSENVTSIGNLLNSATLSVSTESSPPFVCTKLMNGKPVQEEPYVLSVSEVGWGPLTSPNLATINNGGCVLFRLDR